MAIEQEDFSLTEIDRGLFLCRERFYVSGNQANLWIVKGSAMDLVIDTGIGLWDLPGFLKRAGAIGDKPYLAVATHIHFDHSGGLHQFEEFAIHRLEAKAIQKGDNYETCAFMNDSDISKPPCKNWSAKNYKVPAAEPTRLLDDGDVLDLGNRKIRVLHLPGHSRGSIALYEDETRTLFSGDIIYDGLLIDWLPYSNVSEYVKSCETLLTLAPSVDRVCPGHNNHFTGSTLQRLLFTYISNARGCHRPGSSCLKSIATVVLKGRNTGNVPAKCCFFACCCCRCVCL
ncbi:metallo-beta-lactamase domain-containing protein 2-like [Actinia tenebrosa]|uniref:Metallo-beta-lactamase domain-containing protein 2-like n=1 Tax=Actinia tenebrosa TaxID=6105 RepID=A0A6P8IJ63_ACTTE|nr:metallo-beta-lactamase domain-containing protein 2-like [Actinia tenebrosa]